MISKVLKKYLNPPTENREVRENRNVSDTLDFSDADIEDVDFEEIEDTNFTKRELEDLYTSHNIEYFKLTDFVDLCNNEEIVLDNWWIGYVNLI